MNWSWSWGRRGLRLGQGIDGWDREARDLRHREAGNRRQGRAAGVRRQWRQRREARDVGEAGPCQWMCDVGVGAGGLLIICCGVEDSLGPDGFRWLQRRRQERQREEQSDGELGWLHVCLHRGWCLGYRSVSRLRFVVRSTMHWRAGLLINL